MTDSRLSQEVIEVFGYLAYEIVREVSLMHCFLGGQSKEKGRGGYITPKCRFTLSATSLLN